MKMFCVWSLMMAILGWIGSVSAQSPYPEVPLHLRITGNLLPPAQTQREDLITVDIFVQDKPWRLRIGKVEDLTPSERQEQIKEDLLLRQVRFYGASDLLAQIQQAGQSGTTLTIEGHLASKERRFRVTEVKVGKAGSPTKQ